MSKHTPGPLQWELTDNGMPRLYRWNKSSINPDKLSVAVTTSHRAWTDAEAAAADFKRLRDCWNACEGIAALSVG